MCWLNRSGLLNCGACEKGVRTQLQLLAVGALEHVRTFPDGPLAAQIAKVPGVPQKHVRQYHLVLDAIGDSQVTSAVADLLRRTPRWQRRQRVKERLADLRRALRP